MTSPNPHPNAHPNAGPYQAAQQIAAQLVASGERAKRLAEQTVRQYGLLLQTRVMANASGRPGPRVRTGSYRRSINVRYAVEGGNLTATVGTASPQARRLEYGFVGVDRANRHYNQPPFPHFGPAVLRTEPEFREAIRRIVST